MALVKLAELYISGGGLRATFMGAGIFNALDGRNVTSAEIGTGGLLQALDYTTGLSGGSCLVMALAQANFPMMYEAALGSEERARINEKTDIPLGVIDSWLAYINFVLPAALSPVGSPPILSDAAWWTAVVNQVLQKSRAGFEITIGDIYARVLGYHFVNGTTKENFFDPNAPHGQGLTLSGLERNVPTIQNASQPFPIITAVPESPNQDESRR
ncbi:acyl transferase/acyl hydrolase/lysophospholipase [Phakopsora pachyrhizi]|nr:acyl transferase/acyl hydrolase/lysophospholipase [Phakopsora pachyrhizi]